MVCTKQSFTIAASWTAVDLAALFRDAFIAAGLMSDWHDNFTNSNIQSRILRVVHDATKAYGTTFYWFMFTVDGIYLQTVLGWDTVNKVPTGTVPLDYLQLATNTVSNHWWWLGAQPYNGFAVTLNVFTSGENADVTFLQLRRGTNRAAFTIQGPGQSFQPYIDLNKGFVPGFEWVSINTMGNSAAVRFMPGPTVRRDLILGAALRNTFTSTYQTSIAGGMPRIVYSGIGRDTGSSAFGTNVQGMPSSTSQHGGGIILPMLDPLANPAVGNFSNPVYHSMIYNPYIVDSLPSDFGINFHYDTNVLTSADRLIVTSEEEEWEILTAGSNSTAGIGASGLFLARVV